MSCASVILAAGKGTRMSGDLPKVLHEIDGRPMVAYVVDAVRALCGERIYLVVGYKAETVKERCAGEGVTFVLQEEQLGTGHAVMQCEEALEGFAGTVVVLNGDVPGLRAETVRNLWEFHRTENAAATVLTAELDDPTGYGRILRDDDGAVARIVEQKDADRDTRAIREINSGLFCFDKVKLFDVLRSTGRENAQGEYYLTDVIEVLKNRGGRVAAFRVADSREVAGVNTDDELEMVRNYIKE